MDTRMAVLRYKEIVNIADGCRYGYVGDMEVDTQTGRVNALIIPGRLRFFGLLGREPDRRVPWPSIRRIGEDIILVETAPEETKTEPTEKNQIFSENT